VNCSCCEIGASEQSPDLYAHRAKELDDRLGRMKDEGRDVIAMARLLLVLFVIASCVPIHRGRDLDHADARRHRTRQSRPLH
jgi:hypothetical protein